MLYVPYFLSCTPSSNYTAVDRDAIPRDPGRKSQQNQTTTRTAGLTGEPARMFPSPPSNDRLNSASNPGAVHISQ